MDAPVRANAAQLAARKIKEKPKTKRTGTTPKVDPSNAQWASPSSQPGEGLFGGSVQASGGFNFNPPGGPVFPPSTFGNGGNMFGGGNNNVFGGMSNGNGSDQESDRPVDNRPSKKPFGSSTSAPAPQNNNTFQMPNFGPSQPTSTNPFGSQGGSNLFGGAPPSPAPSFGTAPTTQTQPNSPFSFGASSSQAPSSPGITQPNKPFSFGGSSQAPPSPSITQPNKPFSFGGTSQAPPSSSINFGTGPTAEKPASNVFNFGQTTSQQTQSPAPTPSFFSQATTNPEPKPSSSPFSFGQTSKTPSNSGINFGSAPAAASPAKDFFGNTQPQSSAQPPNLFGTSSTATSPTKDLFGKLSGASAIESPQPQMSNLFGNTTSTAPPLTDLFANKPQSPVNGSSNTFGTNQQPPQNPVNPFGSLSPAPSASPAFGEQKSQPGSSVFGALKPNDSSSNPFSSLQSQPEQVSNFFASPSKPATPVANIFGSLPKPTDQSVIQSNVNGAVNDRQTSPEKSSAPTSDLFAHLNKPLGQPTAQPKFNGAVSPPKTAANSTPSISGLFGSSSKPVAQPDTRHALMESNQAAKSSARSETQDQSKKQIDWAKVDWNQFKGITLQPHNALLSKPRVFAQDIPFFKEPQSNISYTPEVISLMDSTSRAEVEQNFRAYELLAPTIPDKAPSMTREEGGLVYDTNGDLAAYPKLFPGLYYAKTFPLEYMAPLVPKHFSPELRIEFYVAYRMKVLNNELRRYFDTVSVTTNVIPATMFYQLQRRQILQRGTEEYTMELRRLGVEPKLTHSNTKSPTKRAADAENQENEPPSKRTKQFGMPNVGQQPTEQAVSASPKPQAANPQPYLNGNAPAAVPSTQLFQPSVPAASLAPSPSKGKRKGDDLDQDMPQPKRNSPLKQVNMQNLNGDASGSNASKMMKSILESPAKTSSPAKPASERKILGSPAKPVEDAPHSNPFKSLPVPASPKASVSPGNMFAPKPQTSPTKSPSPKLPAASPALVNPFVPKPSASNSTPFSSTPFGTSSTTAGATEPKPFAIKPPTFGAINFNAQFAESAANEEKKLLEKAIDEDYDSDDGITVEEFSENFRKERAAKLKSLKETAKSAPTFKFKPAQPSVADTGSDIPKSITQDSNPPTSFFGLSPSPLNGSRASTPGVTSNSGSVFDEQAPAKPVNFGSDFFGKRLASEAGSGKEDDAEEEDVGEDDGAESDSENKDPNYQPGDETNSGPGTPASETGAGIASTKKSLFTFGTDTNSGTSTPSKRRDGEDAASTLLGARMSFLPVSTEEKENTEPEAASPLPVSNGIFSSLNRSVDGTVDQTWKKDSPIKFGATPLNSDAKSAPALSLTAATPTKSSSTFGSTLFGNTKDSKAPSTNLFGTAPQSNLFGSNTISKPSVGFAFGASSTSSSLFPSAAVSASTSRATTPGATTDGESGVDADPDAEHHEQLDLTSGGPGEEDEEVLHEVRARALKFVTKDGQSSWVTKGVGPLRILKNKNTGAARMLHRSDPGGNIVLNKGLLPQIDYKVDEKTVKVTVVGEKPENMDTWVLQVKTQELAEALSEVMEANK